MGTKLRALYQRSKGRDLFDLYYARQHLNLDYEQIITCYKAYISLATGKKPPDNRAFLQNIEEKENNPLFKGDMEGLLRPDIKYNQKEAFDWLKNELITQL